MTDTLSRPERRAKLIELNLMMDELARRKAKAEQSHRGYRDEETGEWVGGLYAFVKYFWHVLEPETPLVFGWPLEAICEHLEAVTFGEINRLLINVPPGFMKSLLVDVFWPAWEWGPMKKGHLRYLTFSYSASLTERDNGRFGDLVSCYEFQRLYGADVKLVQNGFTKVSNRKKGWKLASSVGGVGTGERGDRVILDDPHNVKEAESETVRGEAVRWFRESMSNRLNDMERGAIVIIMQRVHEDDVSGTILSLGLDYVHLMIPMEYEFQRAESEPGVPIETKIGWIDPRYDPDDPDGCDGLLAWEERFPDTTVERIKKEVGPYAFSGQYQQAPAPRGGGIFKRDWWQLWEPPDGKFPVFDLILASLDSAFTEKESNDPSGLTVWGVFTHENRRRLMLVHAWRKHLAFSGIRNDIKPREMYQAWVQRTQHEWGLIEWVQYTCRRFNVDRLLIEAKASGISAAQELRNRFPRENWTIDLRQVQGDKYARAIAAQPTFSQQLVFAPAREWSEMVIDEMSVFPKGRYKDLTDSTTQAIKFFRDSGLAETDQEANDNEADAARYKRPKAPLYPV